MDRGRQSEGDTTEDVGVEGLALLDGLMPVDWRELDDPGARAAGEQAQELADVAQGVNPPPARASRTGAALTSFPPVGQTEWPGAASGALLSATRRHVFERGSGSAVT